MVDKFHVKPFLCNMLSETIKTFGRKGEDLAISHLRALDYEIIARNYFSSYGEIDIIARQKSLLIFVEVKSRSSSFEAAFSSVSFSKQKKLVKTAMHFLSRHKIYEEMFTRFDVIAIVKDQAGEYKLQHMQDAFQPYNPY